MTHTYRSYGKELPLGALTEILALKHLIQPWEYQHSLGITITADMLQNQLPSDTYTLEENSRNGTKEIIVRRFSKGNEGIVCRTACVPRPLHP